MKTLIIANWKANPATVKEAGKIVSSLKNTAKKNQEVIVCPSHAFLSIVKNKGLKLGAQDVSTFQNGAHTGEVTASMLASLGVSHCIVGHSERRGKGETSEMVSEKIKNLIKAKITPILCVGEKIRGQNGEHFEEIAAMLTASIEAIPKKSLSGLVLAYEPLWAISTEHNGAMDPEIIHETIIYLKKVLNDLLGKSIASSVRIIYGGSVDPKNAADIVSLGRAEGYLIGKASLNPKTFLSIISKQ